MSKEKRVVDVRLKSPFTAVVSGPTGSGKTRLLMKLIVSSRWVCTDPPEEIIYCYGEWQDYFETVKGVVFHEGMIDIERAIPNDGRPRWIIIDDLMSEVGGTKETNNLFTKGSHHRNFSVFFITQNAFKKEHRTMSLNAQYYFWFKNPRDNLSIVNFAKQAFPGNTRAVVDAYKQATREPWTFLLMDLRQETDDRARLLGNYASENKPMVVYDVTR
jgi:hypothetical protein